LTTAHLRRREPQLAASYWAAAGWPMSFNFHKTKIKTWKPNQTKPIRNPDQTKRKPTGQPTKPITTKPTSSLAWTTTVPELMVKLMRMEYLHILNAAEAQIKFLAFRAMVLCADQTLSRRQFNPQS
jgi:hypothetical protein